MRSILKEKEHLSRQLRGIKATIHYATKLHAINCNKAVTKLKQSCNTLVTTLLQFVACNFVA